MKTMLKLLLMSLFLFTTACMPEDDEVTPSAESVGNVVMSAGGHTFTVTMEQTMGGLIFRGVGMIRAKANIAMTNLVYNMCRLVQIKKYQPNLIAIQ